MKKTKEKDSMKTRSSSRLVVSSLICLLLCAALTSLAEDGRDFAGSYEVTNVTDLGADIRVTLTVRVFNYSGSDVSNAEVTLEDSLRPGTDYSSYPTQITIADRQSVRISSEFTVSRQEYDYWEKGSAPSLRIDFQNSEGTAVRRKIEMSRGLVGEE
jgi:hypothetical protein